MEDHLLQRYNYMFITDLENESVLQQNKWLFNEKIISGTNVRVYYLAHLSF